MPSSKRGLGVPPAPQNCPSWVWLGSLAAENSAESWVSCAIQVRVWQHPVPQTTEPVGSKLTEEVRVTGVN